uniref:Uncharacterized protein n=1 Tax=Janibacter limosus TaxID=53458 RepID=A0AC61U2X8_9MICO|nr:hypothetical protein [Janibacter limosus]
MSTQEPHLLKVVRPHLRISLRSCPQKPHLLKVVRPHLRISLRSCPL